MTKAHNGIYDLRFLIADWKGEFRSQSPRQTPRAIAGGVQSAIGNWQSEIPTGGPQQMSMRVSRWKK
jgi:hypothetical protein